VVVLVKRRHADLLVSIAALLALAEPFVLWHDGTTRLYFGTDTRAGALVLGAAVSLWWSSGRFSWLRRRGVSSVSIGLTTTALLAAGFGFAGHVHKWSWLGGITLSALAGALLVATLATRRDDSVSRMLARPVLVWIGRRSYAIYLWSYVFNTWFRSLGVATVPVVLTSTLVAAALSYRFVEMPVLRRARRTPTDHQLNGRGANWA
ncbi:MAG: acyltransferase family protein, partial [Acidimicrobiales bacterium]